MVLAMTMQIRNMAVNMFARRHCPRIQAGAATSPHKAPPIPQSHWTRELSEKKLRLIPINVGFDALCLIFK